MSAAFDIEKFAKVQTLAREGATAGERHAAQSRLEAMAKSAGMTVLQATRMTAEGAAPTPPRSWLARRAGVSPTTVGKLRRAAR